MEAVKESCTEQFITSCVLCEKIKRKEKPSINFENADEFWKEMEDLHRVELVDPSVTNWGFDHMMFPESLWSETYYDPKVEFGQRSDDSTLLEEWRLWVERTLGSDRSRVDAGRVPSFAVYGPTRTGKSRALLEMGKMQRKNGKVCFGVSFFGTTPFCGENCEQNFEYDALIAWRLVFAFINPKNTRYEKNYF